MNQVSAIRNLGSRVMYFNGTTISDAIQAAEKFARQNGITLTNYYLQAKVGKSVSIIVDVINANDSLITETQNVM